MSNPTFIPEWKNYSSHLDQIRAAALDSVNPGQILRLCLSLERQRLNVFGDEFPLTSHGRIFLVGAGKAGMGMSDAVLEILGSRIAAGVIAIPDLPEKTSGPVEYIKGGHPLPSEGSIEAGKRIQAILEDAREGDTVIILISGGGSALLELSESGIGLHDLALTNQLLLRSGAPIGEINIIRRKLSRIKGGGLARMAAPAEVIALILSDVIGDPLADIASGLTVDDPTTSKDALDILEKFQLIDQVPDAIKSLLKERDESDHQRSEGVADFVHNYVIGNIQIASETAKVTAERLGFRAILVSNRLQGEAKIIGRQLAALLRIIRHTIGVENTPVCLIFGGETTVTVKGDGIGGRNQELALSAAIELENAEKVALMALATDGRDGPTESAGAIVTGNTVSIARLKGLDPSSLLANNDSYSFFATLGDTIITGPTGTNVNDMVIGLIY